VAVNYQPIGSGAGIKLIESKAVDFGASDAPLRPAELDKFGLLQFPIVVGGDVPVVNLPGIERGKLKLTGPVLADIYLGKITRWSDKSIADLNPDLPLPDGGSRGADAGRDRLCRIRLCESKQYGFRADPEQSRDVRVAEQDQFSDCGGECRLVPGARFLFDADRSAG
jgi:hypothetical protein